MDPITSKPMTTQFLDGLLKGKFIAPKASTSNWRIKEKLSKIEIYFKIVEALNNNVGLIGFDETNLPSKEYLSRLLKEKSP